jgi:hypothetical protein
MATKNREKAKKPEAGPEKESGAGQEKTAAKKMPRARLRRHRPGRPETGSGRRQVRKRSAAAR